MRDELYDVDIKQTDKGHVKICGKLKDGERVLYGCIVVAGTESGGMIAVDGKGHERVINVLKKKAIDLVKVK